MRSTGIENGLRNSLRNSPVILHRLMAGFVAMFLCLPVQAFAVGTINIYPHRQQIRIQPFLDAFTKTIGIEAKAVFASRGLAKRLQAGGAASPADIISTVNIAELAEYANLDLLASVESAVLTANIPAHLRAPDNRWFGLSERVRIDVTARDRVLADSIQLVFTNQATRGNHINISGGVVVKHSRNRQQAVASLQFLTVEVVQQRYGKVNYEYPVNPAVTPPAELARWGPFKRDKLPIERLAELALQAQMIIDRVGC